VAFIRTRKTSSPTSLSNASKFREVMTEIKMSEPEWQAFISDKQGAIVGQKLVRLYGFQHRPAGYAAKPNLYRTVEFIVRGICTGGDEKTLFFHHDYVNEIGTGMGKDQVSTFSISGELGGGCAAHRSGSRLHLY